MKNEIIKCRQNVKKLLENIQISNGKGESLSFDKGFEEAINIILRQSDAGGKLIFIGNGASASIASHIATDFWRNVGIKAIAFNDASGLTCIANDFGYQHVFEKPIEIFGDSKDILIAISSSGRSKNILQAVDAAKKKDAHVVTLSGFEKDNPLGQMGDINFYVPSSVYGHVEVIHHFICHSFIDVIMSHRVKVSEKGESL